MKKELFQNAQSSFNRQKTECYSSKIEIYQKSNQKSSNQSYLNNLKSMKNLKNSSLSKMDTEYVFKIIQEIEPSKIYTVFLQLKQTTLTSIVKLPLHLSFEEGTNVLIAHFNEILKTKNSNFTLKTDKHLYEIFQAKKNGQVKEDLPGKIL